MMQMMKQPETLKEASEAGMLERENQMLREALIEARQERDRWHQIAERLSIAPPAPASIQKKNAEGFWSRLLGRSNDT